MSIHQTLLNEICKQPGGTDINEAIQATGLDYKTIERTAYELISQGYHVRALAIGRGRLDGKVIKRLYLSQGDPRYNELVLKQEAGTNV